MKRLKRIKDMNKILFIIPLLYYTICCYSQVQMINPSTVPTPNQGSLGQVCDVPVSAYSGKANINIPIYNTSQRGVDLNIVLFYDTSGILINQLPGWVGHNWTLSAGGAITRVINGSPDEINFEGTNAGRDLFIWSNLDDCEIMSNGVFKNRFDALNNTNYYNQLYNETLDKEKKEVSLKAEYMNYFRYTNRLKNASTSTSLPNPNKYDSSADIFYFNFMGITGSFFYGNDGNWKVRSEYNIDVIFDVEDSTNYIDSYEKYFFNKENIKELTIVQPKTIKGFTIVDEKGNQYIFGGDKSYIEYSMSLARKNRSNTTEPWNAVSWMLKEVRDRFNNELYLFSYSRGSYVTQIQNAFNKLSRTTKSSDIKFLYGNHTYPRMCSGTLNSPLYIDSIKIADGTKIVFNHTKIYAKDAFNNLYPCGINKEDMLKGAYQELINDPNFDYIDKLADPVYNKRATFIKCNEEIDMATDKMNIEALVNIRINGANNSDGTKCQNVNFIYSFESRMHLKAIQMDENKHYLFDYNSFKSLPKDYATKKIDNWGYYNGIDYDKDTSDFSIVDINKPEYINRVNNKKLSHVPNIDYGVLGMLNKITYPTGGSICIDYEQNSCSGYISYDRKNFIKTQGNIPAGGLRVKKISTFCDNMLVKSKTYKYEENDRSNLSSGQLSALPYSIYKWSSEEINESNKKIVYYYKIENMCSVVPLSNSLIPTIGYSRVKEIMEDGSCNVYEYSNYSDEKDEEFIYSRFGKNVASPYDKYSSRQYMCGKLIREITLDSKSDTFQIVRYEYTTDKEFNTKQYSISSSSSLNPIFGKVGSIFKLYYFNPGVKGVFTSTKYGNSWINNETTFERDTIGLNIKYKDSNLHKVYLYKNLSETQKCGPDEYKTVYSYPFQNGSLNLSLVNQFCFPVIESRTYINRKLTGGNKVFYRTYNGISVPSKICEYFDDASKQTVLEEYLSYYPDFRIKEYADRTGIRHKLFWNANDKLVASISNATDNIVFDDDIDEIIKQNSDKIFVAKPIGASFYKYNAMGLVSRIVEQNKKETGFSYDMLGRLTKTDINKRTTNEFVYNYGNFAGVNMESYGIYTENKFTHVYSDRKVLKLNYQLSAEVQNAEIRVIRIYSQEMLAKVDLPVIRKSGSVEIIQDKRWSGAIKILLVVDNKKADDQRISGD